MTIDFAKLSALAMQADPTPVLQQLSALNPQTPMFSGFMDPMLNAGYASMLAPQQQPATQPKGAAPLDKDKMAALAMMMPKAPQPLFNSAVAPHNPTRNVTLAPVATAPALQRNIPSFAQLLGR